MKRYILYYKAPRFPGGKIFHQKWIIFGSENLEIAFEMTKRILKEQYADEFIKLEELKGDK